MSAPLPALAFAREAEDVIYTTPAPQVHRWEWRHQFGTMVIEVRGDEMFVDDSKVERLGTHLSGAPPAAGGRGAYIRPSE